MVKLALAILATLALLGLVELLRALSSQERKGLPNSEPGEDERVGA